MSAAALQPAQAKAPAAAAAPPSFAPVMDNGAIDVGPSASLARIPVSAPPPQAQAQSAAGSRIQRKCAGCEREEQELEMTSDVRPRLEVGAADDPFEREADAIAGQVMALRDTDIAAVSADAGAAPASVQRACTACSNASKDDDVRARRVLEDASEDELKSATVRRRSDGVVDRDDEDVPRMRQEQAAHAGETIAASSGELTRGGISLPERTRQFFEMRMGRDLSHVRLHVGTAASALSRSIRARAFTYENHIWLGSGESAAPSFTMAHELAHVLQQTSPGPVGPAGVTMARRDEGVHTDAVSVRRALDEAEPYFAPRSVTNNLEMHKKKHTEAQAALRGSRINRGLLTEVPIPGADRNKIEIGERSGYADLYYAKTKVNPRTKSDAVPGVQAIDNGGSGHGLANFTNRNEPATVTTPSGPVSVAKGATVGVLNIGGVSNFEAARAPKIDWAAGALTDTDRMPTNIQLGEVKSAHSISYRRFGIDQLNNYIAGINAAAQAANSGFPGTNWSPNPKRMKGSDIDLPKSWDPSRKHRTWPVKDIEIRWSKKIQIDPSTSRRITAKAGPKKRVKKPAKPDKIAGKWMIAKGSRRKDGGDGIFVYYLHPKPSDLKKALKNGNVTARFQDRLADMHQIPAKLRKPPKKATKAAAKAAPLRIARKPHQSKVRRKAMKDDFSAPKWEAFRRGKKGLDKESKNNVLDQLHNVATPDILAMVNRRAALAEWVNANPDNAKIDTDITTEARESKPLLDFKFLKKAAFWTSGTARPIGILRDKFGGVVVKGINKFEEFKAKVKAKIEERKNKALAKNKKKSGKIMMKAAKAIMAALLPILVQPLVRQTFALIMDCVETGFKAKFKSLLPEDGPLADLQQMADDIDGKVDAMSTEIEATIDAAVNQIVGEYEGKVQTIIDESKNVLKVVSLIKDLANTLRIGACLVSLATAPETLGLGAVVGCGFAIADWILSQLGMSPIDYIIALTLQKCTNKNRIGKLMSGFSVIQTMPQTIARLSITKIKDALRAFVPGEMGGRKLGEHAAELLCDENSIKATAEPFKPLPCGGSGSSGNVPDVPQDILDKAYKKGDPITAEERKQMHGRDHAVPKPEAQGGKPEKKAQEQVGGTDESANNQDDGLTVDVSNITLSNEEIQTDEKIQVWLYLSGSISPDTNYQDETINATLKVRRSDGIVLTAANKRFRISSIPGRSGNSSVQGWPVETLTWRFEHTGAGGKKIETATSIENDRRRPFTFNIRRPSE